MSFYQVLRCACSASSLFTLVLVTLAGLLTGNAQVIDSSVATDAGLDPTFAPVFETRFGAAYALKIQPDGKFLVGGTFKSLNGHASSGIIRLNADRSSDAGFSANVRGTVYSIAFQADGKIVIGGTFYAVNGAVRNSLARLNADGTIDTSFTIPFTTDGSVRDIVIQPDGKIIVVGDFVLVNGVSSPRIGRLNTDGTLDTTFQSSIATGLPSFPTLITSVVLQGDGKIVVGGRMLLQGGSMSDRKWVLRFNSDGSVDPSLTSPFMNDHPWQVALQPDGKVVVGGYFNNVAGVSRNHVARLNSDGTLDTSFNPGAGNANSVRSVVVLPSGKILIAGEFSTFGGAPIVPSVAKLNSDGSLDNTFAPAGTTTGPVYGLTQAPDGRYLAWGSFISFASSFKSTLAAMNADGSLDQAFTAEAPIAGTVGATAVLTDGKVLVGGVFSHVNGALSRGLSRFNTDGTRDASFDANNITAISVGRFVFQPDGKILVIGSGIRVNGALGRSMIRLHPDGTPDSSFLLGSIPTLSGFGFSAAVQPDGKILYAHNTADTPPGAMVRLNSDGSVDSSFTTANRRYEALHLLPNGQILAAGPFGFAYVGPGGTESHHGIVRLNADGSHDRTFRSALANFPTGFSEVHAMHVQQDGKMLLGGKMFVEGNLAPFGVLRMNETGTIDGAFQGQSISGQFYFTNVFTMHVTPSGNILAGGAFENFGGQPRNNIVRLESSGAIDSTFGAATDGRIDTVITRPDGSILIGGNFETVNGVARPAFARLLTQQISQQRAPFDFDGDGKTDIGIFRPSVAEWWINRSSTGVTTAGQFGASTDSITPADFTGDAKADIAFFRPSTGEWFVLRSEDFSYFAFPFGTNGDIPAPADYDADGKADATVFRPSTATWFIRRSTDGGATIQQFGASGDVPVAADYDRDGKADIAIYRPAVGEWWVQRSTGGVSAVAFGNASDKPVQGDFTGDGKADVAFWRPSTGDWFVLRSEDSSYFSFPFGTTGDIPAPGDYDGDGKFDATVFRPSTATWYSQRSTAGVLIQQFGATGDRPIPNAFVP